MERDLPFTARTPQGLKARWRRGRKKHYFNKKAAEFWIEDGAIASAYILLAVEQYGLGACWVHIRNRKGTQKTSDEEIRELLGVPDGYTVLNLVAIGEKGENKKAYTDSDLHTENIHYETY